jgi:hypothetical protein
MGSEDMAALLLTLATDGGKWSTSCPIHFTFGDPLYRRLTMVIKVMEK